MGVILEALREIEARESFPSVSIEPIASEELASLGLNRPASPWNELLHDANTPVGISPVKQKPPDPAQPSESGEYPGVFTTLFAVDWTESSSIPGYSTRSLGAKSEPELDSKLSALRSIQETQPFVAGLFSGDPSRPDLSRDRIENRSIRDIETGLRKEFARNSRPERIETKVENISQPDPTESDKDRSYHDLAQSILKRLDHSQATIMLVTGLEPDKRRSELVVLLSRAITKIRKDDLLIVDADFHHPCLAGHFGVDAPHGLCDILSGKQNWQSAIHSTCVGGLHLLASGVIASGNIPRPNNTSMATLLKTLSEQFKLVILDTSSLADPETRQIAAYCDATLLVIAMGQTGQRAVHQAVQRLEKSGGRVLGCVVTES